MSGLKSLYPHEFSAFASAKQRCTNPKSQQYKHYGARGIRFLFPDFVSFLVDVGERPDNFVLDRIDVNGNYEQGNIRWVSKSESARNKRKRAGVSSQLMGVSKFRKGWRASLKDHGKFIHIGIFNTEESAHQAYLEATRELNS